MSLLMEKGNVKTEWFTEKEEDKQISLWYSGSICMLQQGKLKAFIDVRGDVIASYRNKEEDVIITVIDKTNTGDFKNQFSPIFENDDELLDNVQNGQLKVINHNCFEISIAQEGSMQWVMKPQVTEAYYLYEAIQEAKVLLNKFQYDV